MRKVALKRFETYKRKEQKSKEKIMNEILKPSAVLSSEVDLWSAYKSHTLFARHVWQLLFNEYRKGVEELTDEEKKCPHFGLNHMDNMLCDYTALCSYFEHGVANKEIWWKFHARSGMTNITDEEPQLIWEWDYHGYFVSDPEKGVFKFVLEKLIHGD